MPGNSGSVCSRRNFMVCSRMFLDLLPESKLSLVKSRLTTKWDHWNWLVVVAGCRVLVIEERKLTTQVISLRRFFSWDLTGYRVTMLCLLGSKVYMCMCPLLYIVCPYYIYKVCAPYHIQYVFPSHLCAIAQWSSILLTGRFDWARGRGANESR